MVIALINIARFFLSIVLLFLALASLGTWTAPAPVMGVVCAIACVCYFLLAVRITVRAA